MGSRTKKKRHVKAAAEASSKRAGSKLGLVGLAAVVVGLGVALWLSHERSEPVSGPLNLVLVSVDTLRADHLSCYGGSPVPTPNMDGLAAEGALFEQVQTVAPTTLPAHASLFTGVTPIRHGVRDNVGFYLATDPPTLASILGAAGYRTGGFVGAFVLDSRFGIGRGFDTYYDRFDSNAESLTGGFVSQRRGEMVLDEALKWMDRVKTAPFFTFIHFYDPHTPYDPPPPFVPSDQDNRALYAGEVAYVDAQVGRLLQWLEDRDLAGRSIVVLTSDHGESLGEHGEQTHGFFLYEAALRVPLIMRYPGVKQGTRIGDLVRIIDILPTLLDLLDVPSRQEMEGQSLVSLLETPNESLDLLAYAETYLPRLHYGWSELRSLRRGPHKLILAPRNELYRLDQDPVESRNLYEEQTETALYLKQDLEELLGPTSRELPEAAQLDPDSLGKLQRLGYVGGASRPQTDASYSELPDPKDRVSIYERINDPGLSDVGPGDAIAFQQALAEIESILDEDASMPRAHVLHGELLLKAGRASEAVRSFERALSLHPDSFAATYGLAMAFLAQGRADRAEAQLRRAVEIEPRNTKSYFRLAALEKTRGRLESAETWLRRAIDVHPERALQEMLAEVLLATGRNAEAEKLLSDLAAEYGEDAITLYNLGQTLLSRGESGEALKYLRRASQLAPSDADIPHALGNALAASGNVEAAIAEYQRAIALSPCFAGAYSNLGTAYLELGSTDEAIRSYEKAIDCDSDYVTAYTNLASVVLQLGQLDRALDTLRQAVRLRPNDPVLQKALSELEAQVNRR